MYTQKFWRMSNSDIFNQLQSSEKGLTETQVDERLNKYGINEISKRKTRIGIIIFLSQFKNLKKWQKLQNQ